MRIIIKLDCLLVVVDLDGSANEKNKKETNMHFCLRLIILLLSLTCTVLRANTNDPLKPLRTDHPPVIDGILDDPVWQEAPYVTGFKTFVPDFGKDMVEKTKGYVAYDAENIYFAFKCYDSQPDKIKAAVSARDNVRPDDWVCINLDSFNDQQSLYAFYVNPLGIQGDSRYSGGTEDLSVDIVWYSAGRIDDEGYAIEIQIPLKSIRFSNKNPVEMSIFFERRISRRSEQGSYPPLDPAMGMAFLPQMKPMIFHDLKNYTLFELLPAVTYLNRQVHSEGKLKTDERQGDLSLTTKYGFTPQLILDGTYNPDFSQVESDAGQVDVNLRYQLYFSEKRPFFLEGNENFNVAATSSHAPIRSVVHTRTIVDPLVGIKLSGKIGKKNMLASIYAVDELNESQGLGEYAHFAILRYKRALNEDSFIGGIYTGRELKNRYNRVAGVDGMLRITKASMLSYYGLLSQTHEGDESENKDGHGVRANYNYSTRNLSYNLSFTDVSENFNAEAGYIRRTGITIFSGSFSPKFYPEWDSIRRIGLTLYSTQSKDHPSDLWETFNYTSLSFLLWRNSRITLSSEYSTEVFLDERFKTSRTQISGSSQFTKRFYFSLSFNHGQAIYYSANPYQGKSSRASASVIYQPSENIKSEIRYTYSDFKGNVLPENDYGYSIFRTKLTYQVNRYLFFRGIVEYNDYNREMLSDILASFTYIPGTVIHIGYGSLHEKIRWRNDRYLESDRFLQTRRGFFFKASYLWRM